jgi:hypothetical protein
MNIIKFKVLQEGDQVIKVSDDLLTIHVLKMDGSYVVYKLKRNDNENELTVCDFDVFAITKGIGSFEIIQDAETEDYLDM